MSNKISLIIAREYFSRVKKKSFIIMTFLTPILLVALMLIPAYVAMKSEEKNAVVGVCDKSGFYENAFQDNERLQFKIINSDEVEAVKKNLSTKDIDMLLIIPPATDDYPVVADIYSDDNVNTLTKSMLKDIMQDKVKEAKLTDLGIEPETLKKLDVKIKIDSFKVNLADNGVDIDEEQTYSEANQVIGYIGGFLMYFFIFLFGSQVMRGVMEEKTSRIVEVIISSVKPFQLMMGKIIGIGLVGLTQFVMWIVLSFVLITAFGSSLQEKITPTNIAQVQQITAVDPTMSSTDIAGAVNNDEITPNDEFSEIFNMISSINIPLIILTFLFYFLAGYLLYASFFAAIGGAVDNETDTQQFMLPITIPVILPILLIGNIISAPSGPLAVWLSMIPLTSPIAMMMRLPFGVPAWQLALSMFLLVVFFVISTWLAAKIYRTGILMYGKKVTWAELWKWIKY